jgi:hypothetical protein
MRVITSSAAGSTEPIGEPAPESRAADAPNTFPPSAPGLRDEPPPWVDPYLTARVWDDYGMRKRRC